MTGIAISSRFDSGNIEVLDSGDAAAIRLAIRPDAPEIAAEYAWFHFIATGGRGQDCNFRIENAGGTRWAPAGWQGYRIVASYDGEDWFRLATEFDGQTLSWRHRPERDRIWYAYHAPYPETRRTALLARIAASPRARVEVLGHTLDGRDMELVTIGAPGPSKRACWIVARHHPGETQGEFAAERILERLTDEADPVVRRLLEKATFYVIPNMNPDGSGRGHHRVNAASVDLNRAWSNSTPDKSPEVFLVRERMRATGVDFCLDLHADEREHWVWPVGTTGIPSFTERLSELRSSFDRTLVRASPDYRPDKPDRKLDMAAGTDPLAMCTSWVAETFDCLAVIIELPFLDNTEAPDLRTGWSPRRSALFGAACLDALAALIDELR